MSLSANCRSPVLEQRRWTGAQAFSTVRPRMLTSSRRSIVTSAAQQESFTDSIKRIAKKVQGSLPIIGLVSRLTSPDGGFDELAYPEYCRSIADTAPPSMRVALSELEKKHGRTASSRWVLLVMWMVKLGVGLVPNRDIVNASRRLRVTNDIEVELDRFDITKAAATKKYSMMERPEGKLKDKVNVAVDSLCALCIGLKDGEAVSAEDAPLLTSIIVATITEANTEMVTASIAERPQRATAYA